MDVVPFRATAFFDDGHRDPVRMSGTDPQEILLRLFRSLRVKPARIEMQIATAYPDRKDWLFVTNTTIDTRTWVPLWTTIHGWDGPV